MNKVILMGRLARDPETRYTTTGKAVASFSLAVNRRFSRNNNDQQPTADFIPIIAWDKLADFCGKYLIKGSQILVEGRLQIRSYDDQNGNKRYITEVVANEIEFCGSKQQREGGAPAPMPSGAPAGGSLETANGIGKSVDETDDIPF